MRDASQLFDNRMTPSTKPRIVAKMTPQKATRAVFRMPTSMARACDDLEVYSISVWLMS